MKKLGIVLVLSALLLTFVGCGNGGIPFSRVVTNSSTLKIGEYAVSYRVPSDNESIRVDLFAYCGWISNSAVILVNDDRNPIQCFVDHCPTTFTVVGGQLSINGIVGNTDGTATFDWRYER